MIKVLIADDEHMICEWLQFCIEQNQDCRLVGVANNGRDALELYRLKEPDLVLTDIKMPVMGGLELLHEIRKESARTWVVLLTAFSDFDLAREALRDGVNEYILKTEMDNQTLQTLLNRVCTRLDADKREMGASLRSAETHTIIRDVMLRHGTLNEGDVDTLRQCGVEWCNTGLFALAVWKQQLLEAGVAMPENSPVRQVAAFDYTGRIYVMVVNLPGVSSEVEQKKKLLEYARQMQRSNGCMVGVSAMAYHIRSVNQCIRHAAFALAQGFFEEQSRLYEPELSYADYCVHIAKWKTEAQALQHSLYKMSGPQQGEAVAALLKHTTAAGGVDIELLSSSLCSLLEAVYFTAEDVTTAPALEDACRQIMTGISMQQTRKLMLSCIDGCSAPRHAVKPRSKAVALALEYIHGNFNTGISLEQTATAVYLNPDYFSRIFKEEMGCTFIAYVTEQRLSRSVQLLEKTAMRVQNIAQAVGYTNVSHFSTIFKKKFGVSPYEFRQQSGKQGMEGGI